jgi:prevent-host-death family protein
MQQGAKTVDSALRKEPEELGVATARRNFADIVNRVIYRREPTVITKNGRQVAAVVPYEALALLAALEAEADIEKARAAFEQYKVQGGISLGDLKGKLGIDQKRRLNKETIAMTIDEAGFLSPDIQVWTEKHRAENNAWFQLAEKLNQVAQRQLTSLSVPANDDVHLVKALLFMRGLFAFQGAILLTERGMTQEACMLIRGCFEAVFCFGALRQDASFLGTLISDNESRRKKLANTLLSLPAKASGLDANHTQMLRGFIARLDQSGLTFESIPIEQVAIKAKLKEVYDVYYRGLSGEAAHVTVNSLTRNFDASGDGELKWGPDQSDVEDTLVAACTAALYLVAWVNEMNAEEKVPRDLEESSILYKKLFDEKKSKHN